jgi:hypothetical protein
MLVGICFYKSGGIRSVTLFPDEIIYVTAGNQAIPVRNGFSLFESGQLSSLEPDAPIKIPTPIGAVTAYDASAVGIHADSNSLRFDESGRILTLVTSSDRIAVLDEENKLSYFIPGEAPSPVDEDATFILPLQLHFEYEDRLARNTEPNGVSRDFSNEK